MSILTSTMVSVSATPIPLLQFTKVPPIGETGILKGLADSAVHKTHGVAVYFHVQTANGWWTKPSFDAAILPIEKDGTWQIPLSDAGDDKHANKIAAFLVPLDSSPPKAEGTPILPHSILNQAIAQQGILRHEKRNQRLLFFSGYEWKVKEHSNPVGPGPNRFGAGTDNVYVDALGQLHMKITKAEQHFQCAEIISLKSFGYGTYAFTLGSDLGQLDPNIVLGLFTWSDRPEYHYREIDIEFSRWQDPKKELGQYVVQPWDTADNMNRFPLAADHMQSRHTFTWQENEIAFKSYLGKDSASEIMHAWTYTGNDIPKPLDENARINLWLIQGEAPVNQEETEVVLSRFNHTLIK